MLKIFEWLVRSGDNTTCKQTFKETKTGEFVPHSATLSAHAVSKPAGKGYEYGKQGSTKRWSEHPSAKILGNKPTR